MVVTFHGLEDTDLAPVGYVPLHGIRRAVGERVYSSDRGLQAFALLLRFGLPPRYRDAAAGAGALC